MKTYLWSLAVLATFAVVLADGETEEDDSCAREVEPTVFNAITCLFASVELAIPTPNQVRHLIRTRCSNREPMKQCVRDLMVTPPACRREQEVKRYFRLLENLLDDAMEAVCLDQGEGLVKIYRGGLVFSVLNKENAKALESATRECWWASGFTRPKGSVSLEGRLPEAYQSLELFRECFSGYSGEFGNITSDMDAFVWEVAKRIKCPDPESEGVVSCKVLAEGGEGGDCSSVDEVTVRERLGVVTECLGRNSTTTDTLASAQAQVIEYCARRASMKQCMSEAAALGANCLDRNQTRRFDLLRTNMEIVLEVVCAEGGIKFARFIFEKARHRSHIELWSVFRECRQVGNIQDQKTKGLDMRTYESYVTLKNLLGCFLSKGENILPAVNDFADLTRAILARVKCVHPQDDRTVPCESLEKDRNYNTTSSIATSATN